MSDETIEDRVALLEKSERKYREFKEGILDHYDHHLLEIRYFKVIANIMIALIILFSITVAPFAVFQCWKTWNGYGVVVIDMNGTAKCDQCKNK